MANLRDLPDDILALLVEILPDSRPFALSCRSIYDAWMGTIDAKIFANPAEFVAVAAPKFHSMYLPRDLYAAGNLPALKEWRRTSLMKMRDAIECILSGARCGVIDESGATAEWLVREFPTKYFTPYRSYVMCHHHLLRRLLEKSAEIRDGIWGTFGPFITCNHRTLDTIFSVYTPSIEQILQGYHTLTYSAYTYLSLRGIRILRRISPYTITLGIIRSVQLVEVLENFTYLYEIGDGEIREWLDHLRPRLE